MTRVAVAALLVLALNGGNAGAQYARPEVAPSVRPVAPAPPGVVAPSPGVSATPLAPAPTINAPTAVVPNPPPPTAQGTSARPRKCWCYFMNPTTNSRQRSTCEVNCCRGGNQEERC
jgi:hypothetical protein